MILLQRSSLAPMAPTVVASSALFLDEPPIFAATNIICEFVPLGFRMADKRLREDRIIGCLGVDKGKRLGAEIEVELMRHRCLVCGKNNEAIQA